MINTNEYLSHLIQSSGGLEISQSKTIFGQAVRDYFQKQLTQEELQNVADKLLNIVNSLEVVYGKDPDFGSLLHDTIEWSNPSIEERLRNFQA